MMTYAASVAPAGGGRLEHVLHGLVVERRDQGRDHDPAGYSVFAQASLKHRAGAAGWRPAARACAPARDRACRWKQTPSPGSSAPSGPSRSRSRSISADFVTMVTGCSHSASTSRIWRGDAVFALDRLVAVGVGAERDRARLVAGLRELLSQQLGGVGLGEKLGLEVQARRQFEVGVARARVAVDAAVLAAAVRVDRLGEAHVRRVVARDDRACALDGDLGLQLALRRGSSGVQPSSKVSRATLSKRPCRKERAPRR